MNRINPSFLSIDQIQDQYLNGQKTNKSSAPHSSGASFSQILNETAKAAEQAQPVKFSKHAAARLSDRNIEMTSEQLNRLNEGKNQAGEKGIRESLILVDQLAFIVNIPNNTVVTAMNQDDADSNKIFTNIDGAVIA